MTRFRVLTAIGVLALTFGLVPAAQAQNYFSLSYWPASTSVKEGGATIGEWNTGFFVLDYSGVFRPPFGLRASFATGGQSNWSGIGWGGVTDSGTDTIYSVDLFWQRASGNFALRPFVGYGSMQYSSNFTGAVQAEIFRAYGWRIGAEFITMSSGPVQFVGSIAYYPSATFSFQDDGGGGTTTVSSAGTAVDWNLGLQWRPQGGNWGVTVGYRGASMNCTDAPTIFCTAGNEAQVSWSGLFVGVTIQR